MMNLVGPALICLGVVGLSFGIYLLVFANRDKRSDRQKNLDSIAEMRGDKHAARAAVKAPKKGKVAK